MSDKDKEKLEKAAIARRKVQEELVSTELSYVSSLQAMSDIYVKPLRAAAATSSPIIPKESVDRLFSNLETLLPLHVIFLQDLQTHLLPPSTRATMSAPNPMAVTASPIVMSAASSPPTSPAPAVLSSSPLSTLGPQHPLLRFASYFKMYTQYVNNHEKAASLLDELLAKKSSAFAKLCAAGSQDARAKGQSLASLLIMPIQRIPRYKLLLEELLRRTSADDSERPGLEAALAKVMEVAKHINEGVRARETLEKVIELQNQFDQEAETKLELVAPNRFFIRRSTEKILRAVSEPAPDESTEIILFSDVLIFAKPVTGKKYKLELGGQIPLTEGTVMVELGLTLPDTQIGFPSDYWPSSVISPLQTAAGASPSVMSADFFSAPNTGTPAPVPGGSPTSSNGPPRLLIRQPTTGTPGQSNLSVGGTAAASGGSWRGGSPATPASNGVTGGPGLATGASWRGGAPSLTKQDREIKIEDNEVKHDITSILRVTVTSPGARRKRDLIILFSSNEVRDSYVDKMFVAMERHKDNYLVRAMATGYERLALHMIKAGANVNATDNNGWPLLTLAVICGFTSVVDAMIDGGVDVNAKTPAGHTALMLASKTDNATLITSLLKAGADYSLRDTNGQTAFDVGGKYIMTAIEPYKDQALLTAAKLGDVHLVKHLLDARALLTLRDTDGNSALDLAASGGFLPIMISLADAGADVHARNHGGRSPVLAAAANGHADIVTKLIELKVDIDVTDAENKSIWELGQPHASVWAILEPIKLAREEKARREREERERLAREAEEKAAREHAQLSAAADQYQQHLENARRIQERERQERLTKLEALERERALAVTSMAPPTTVAHPVVPPPRSPTGSQAAKESEDKGGKCTIM